MMRALAACLFCLAAMGCVGHGSRTITIQAFGQVITITDTIEEDDATGEGEFSRTFDPHGWRILFGWLLPDKPDEVDE